MQSLLRNILFFSIFLIISISVFYCGSSTEQKKENTVAEQKTYKNLDPKTKYVGIMACRQCHYDKYETFIQTGMGKSFDNATKQNHLQNSANMMWCTINFLICLTIHFGQAIQ